jgi:hypothetical protein
MTIIKGIGVPQEILGKLLEENLRLAMVAQIKLGKRVLK